MIFVVFESKPHFQRRRWIEKSIQSFSFKFPSSSSSSKTQEILFFYWLASSTLTIINKNFVLWFGKDVLGWRELSWKSSVVSSLAFEWGTCNCFFSYPLYQIFFSPLAMKLFTCRLNECKALITSIKWAAAGSSNTACLTAITQRWMKCTTRFLHVNKYS